MNNHKNYIQPTEENVQMTLDKIAEFAKTRKYDVKGELKLTDKLVHPSENQKKVLRNYLTRLNYKMSRSQANRFLHALKKHADGFDARLELSEQEVAIQNARKEWKEAREKAEQALKAYKEMKGDFYK